MNYNPSKKEIKENVEAKLSRYFGCMPKEASRDQIYKAVSMTVKDILTEKRKDFKQEVNADGAKRVYYMSIEFLLGRSLKNNLCNLGLSEKYAKVLKEYAEKVESFQILAGYVDGAVIDAKTVEALAEIPSREVLIAKLLGSIRSPLFKFAYAVKAIADKNGEGEATPAAE